MSLRRSNQDRYLAGVCGGLAAHLGWDSGRLRIVWVLATIFTALGIDPNAEYDLPGLPTFHRVENQAPPIKELLA